jgi:hypothetical protein
MTKTPERREGASDVRTRTPAAGCVTLPEYVVLGASAVRARIPAAGWITESPTVNVGAVDVSVRMPAAGWVTVASVAPLVATISRAIMPQAFDESDVAVTVVSFEARNSPPPVSDGEAYVGFEVGRSAPVPAVIADAASCPKQA